MTLGNVADSRLVEEHAVGRRDAAGVERSGWTALLLGALFMSCAALAFVLFPRALLAPVSELREGRDVACG